MAIKTENTLESFNALLEHGDIEECPGCGAFSAYAWQDVNIDSNTDQRLLPEDGLSDGGELYTEDEYLPAWPDVYHIPSASGLGEWQCGKCKTYWMEKNSPLNSPCFTHSED